MSKTLVFGIVNKGTFYSDNMEVSLKPKGNRFYIPEDGIYAIDVESDDYLNSLEVASVFDFENYVKKRPKMQIINAYTFKGFEVIPFDYIKWQKITKVPMTITNDNFLLDEWQIGKFLYIPHKNILYFYDYKYDNLYEKLQDVKNHFESNKPITDIKQITPEMRFLYTFHRLEKLRIEQEIKKAKEAEYRKTVVGRVETIIKESGGEFIAVKSYQKGYVVDWKMGGYTLNTFMDKNFSIIEAGFCLSGGDRNHTIVSLTKLMGDYIENDEHFSITRR